MKAKGILLASVAGTIVAPAAASAADIAVKAPLKAAPAVAVAPSWAGSYIGVHAGVAWHRSTAHQNDTIGYYGPATLKDTQTGFIGGGQIGHNWQSGNFVWGLEADISGLDAKTKASIDFFDGSSYAATATAESDIEWMATARARVGVASGNLLAFVTGGIAVAEIRNTLTHSEIFDYTAVYSEKKTRTGPVLGGGVEYLFTPNWTARLEALWADFGKNPIAAAHDSNGNTFTGFPVSFENRVVVVRGALNYKF